MKKLSSLLVFAALLAPSLAFAEDGAHKSYVAVAAAVAIGLAAFGGALGQGRLVAAGLESIGRNPASAQKLFVPFILGLAFVEALVILSFVIAIQLAGKV